MMSAEHSQHSSSQLSQYWAERAQSQLGIDSKLAQPQISLPIITSQRLLSLARYPMLSLILVEGESATLCRHLRLLVAVDKRELHYILNLTGMSEAKRTYLGRTLACKPLEPKIDFDLAIVTSNRLLCSRFSNAGYHVVPGWLRLFLDLADDPETIIRKTGSWLKTDLRKIKTMGFTHEITADETMFDEFYDNMYVPYAQSRYGETAIVRNRQRAMQYFRQGHLMIIKNNTSAVAGCLIEPKGSVLLWPFLGVLNGDVELMKQGVSSAMYLAVIKWAHSNGYKAVNFSQSRAFISDGPLRYKLKWGMRIMDDDDAIRDISIKFNPNSEAARAFIKENPFVYLRDGRLAVYSL